MQLAVAILDVAQKQKEYQFLVVAVASLYNRCPALLKCRTP
jgi:hypothetical protein